MENRKDSVRHRVKRYKTRVPFENKLKCYRLPNLEIYWGENMFCLFEVFTEAFIPSKKVLREKEIIKKNTSKATYLRKGKGKKIKDGSI